MKHGWVGADQPLPCYGVRTLGPFRCCPRLVAGKCNRFGPLVVAGGCDGQGLWCARGVGHVQLNVFGQPGRYIGAQVEADQIAYVKTKDTVLHGRGRARPDRGDRHRQNRTTKPHQTYPTAPKNALSLKITSVKPPWREARLAFCDTLRSVWHQIRVKCDAKSRQYTDPKPQFWHSTSLDAATEVAEHAL